MATQTAYAPGFYTVSAPTNFRQQPGTGARVLFTLIQGETVQVRSAEVLFANNHGWQKVEARGQSGYIAVTAVRLHVQSGLTSPALVSGIPTRLRSQPSTSASIVGTIHPYGQLAYVDTYEPKDGWLSLRLSSGAQGWAAVEYLDILPLDKPTVQVVPHTTQQDNKVSNDCGQACVHMLALFRALVAVPSVESLARLTGTTNRLTGLDDLMRMATFCGFSLDKFNGGSLLTAVRMLKDRRPPILLVDYGEFGRRPVAYDGGHWVVLTGIDGSTVTLNDPLQRLPNWMVSLHELSKAYMNAFVA